jgi:hypothetical protein
MLLFAGGLCAELERNAAQDEPDQHDCNGEIKRGQDHAVRDWKGHKQQPHREHQPGLVGIPKGADRRDHAIFFFLIPEGQKDAHPKVKAVEHDIDEDRDAHESRRRPAAARRLDHQKRSFCLTPPGRGPLGQHQCGLVSSGLLALRASRKMTVM